MLPWHFEVTILSRGSFIACHRTLLPRDWLETTTGRRISEATLPIGFDSSSTAVLGGICSLFTADWEYIQCGKLHFERITEFSSWLSSWYPRIDQIYGCVGVPHPATKKIFYVVEDSFFAERLAALYTSWDPRELTQIFRETHRRFGERAILNWLSENGYRGLIQVVYTSDLDRELKVALRCFEQSIGMALEVPQFNFPKSISTQATINMMYTPFWSSVLGISGSAVVYEPSSHGLEIDTVKGTKIWLARNPYGDPTGLCGKFGKIGYQEFKLSTNLLPTRSSCTWDRILNRENYVDLLSESSSQALSESELRLAFDQLVAPLTCRIQQDLPALRRALRIRLRSIWE